jgi:co-chaperonin GroES (HSP10)
MEMQNNRILTRKIDKSKLASGIILTGGSVDSTVYEVVQLDPKIKEFVVGDVLVVDEKKHNICFIDSKEFYIIALKDVLGVVED